MRFRLRFSLLTLLLLITTAAIVFALSFNLPVSDSSSRITTPLGNWR